ncbi:PTS transporter subunit EIIC [Clostridium polyendosporum]
MAAMSNIAQGGATLTVFFITKDKKIKSIASASGISALLDITEPAMFGINLKLKYLFLGAIIGSGIASAFVTFFKVKAVGLGSADIAGIISIKPGSIVPFAIGMIIAFIAAFSLTIVLAKRATKKDIVDSECQEEMAS